MKPGATLAISAIPDRRQEAPGEQTRPNTEKGKART